MNRKPDEKALRQLVIEAIEGLGDLAPDELPHRVRQKLRDQATGAVDLDALIREALEAQSSGRRPRPAR